MPEWVIVGNAPDGEPLVLSDWIFGGVWTAIANVKEGRGEPVVFRDRWRAKRQTRRLLRICQPRAIRRDRL